MRRLLPDPFILALLITVAVATVAPCRGVAATFFTTLTSIAIALLFFLHGVRLAREAIVEGITHWRLHLTILVVTFALYPIIGILISRSVPNALPKELWAGVLFVCMLPSTVQSSIAFTSIAKGNVAGAICAAAASNLVGILLTPALVAWILRAHAAISGEQIWKIVEQLLIPFVLGHLLRPWLLGFAQKHRYLLMLSDRGSILLVVYTAFSAAVIEGIWTQIPGATLLALVVVEIAILVVVLGLAAAGSRLLGFPRADEVTVVMCGSKKSLASGIPMANVLFAGPLIGSVVIPLMIYHQLQLMVAAWLARRYAARAPAAPEATRDFD